MAHGPHVYVAFGTVCTQAIRDLLYIFFMTDIFLLIFFIHFFQISTNVHSRLIIVTRMPSVLIQKAISRALVKLDLVVTVIFAQVCIASLVKFYKKNYFHTVKKKKDGCAKVVFHIVI